MNMDLFLQNVRFTALSIEIQSGLPCPLFFSRHRLGIALGPVIFYRNPRLKDNPEISE
jgi:hypothetical protein